jgi:hypothetical protein
LSESANETSLPDSKNRNRTFTAEVAENAERKKLKGKRENKRKNGKKKISLSLFSLSLPTFPFFLYVFYFPLRPDRKENRGGD